MMNKVLVKFFLLIVLSISLSAYSRNLSNSNRDTADAAQRDEIYKAWRSQMDCLGGYRNDGRGNCISIADPVPSQPSKSTANERALQDNKSVAAEASLIAKYRAEIVQRCGIPETPTTKIVGMKDVNQPTSFVPSIDRVWTPHWMVKYRIDTENVVFGERQYVIKICIVDKKTGTVEVRDE